MKTRVLIESPFGRNVDGSKCTADEYDRNEVYVRRALKDSLQRGEAPFASHALYTLVLHDTDLEERKMGMEAGFAWGAVTDIVAVYTDYGITPGMNEGLLRWWAQELAVEHRTIGENPTPQTTRFTVGPIVENK